MLIFIALALIPVIEIALFIEIGGSIGLWPTIGLIILTAIIGATLVRQQGFAAMAKLQESIAREEDPRGPLAEGVMILMAGFMLLTPGFFTDTVGFLLLLPPVRQWMIAKFGPALAKRSVRVNVNAGARASNDEGPIDVDYEDITDAKPDPDRPKSGWTLPRE